MNKLKYKMQYTSYTGKYIDLYKYYKEFCKIDGYSLMEGVLGDEYNFTIVKGDYHYVCVSLYDYIDDDDRVNIYTYTPFGYDKTIQDAIDKLIVRHDWFKTKENFRKCLKMILKGLLINGKNNKIRCRKCYKFNDLEECIDCQVKQLLDDIEEYEDYIENANRSLNYQGKQLEYLTDLNATKREHYYYKGHDYDPSEDYKEECSCKSRYRYHYCKELENFITLTKNKIKGIKTKITQKNNKIMELNAKIKALKESKNEPK